MNNQFTQHIFLTDCMRSSVIRRKW